MNKDKEIHGLMKIPDAVIIKQQNIEIGKLKAYIAELEDILTKKTNVIKSGSIEALIQANTQLKKNNQKLLKRIKEYKS